MVVLERGGVHRLGLAVRLSPERVNRCFVVFISRTQSYAHLRGSIFKDVIQCGVGLDEMTSGNNANNIEYLHRGTNPSHSAIRVTGLSLSGPKIHRTFSRACGLCTRRRILIAARPACSTMRPVILNTDHAMSAAVVTDPCLGFA